MTIQGAAHPVPWRPQSAPAQDTSRPQSPTTSAKFDPGSRGPESTAAPRPGDPAHRVSTDSHRVANRAATASPIGHHSRLMADIEKFWKDGEAKEKEFAARGLDDAHPEVRRHHRGRMEKLFSFQTKVMNSALQVEMASKLVEHATTGTRTILQTQA